MIYENICVKKEYTTKSGENKVRWLPVGTLKINDDGKKFIDLNMFPGTSFYVFPQEKKEDQKESNSSW